VGRKTTTQSINHNHHHHHQRYTASEATNGRTVRFSDNAVHCKSLAGKKLNQQRLRQANDNYDSTISSRKLLIQQISLSVSSIIQSTAVPTRLTSNWPLGSHCISCIATSTVSGG